MEEQKLTMTRERFENIRKMIESPDKDNQVMGLSILEEQNFHENVAFILLAKKYSHAGNAEWEANAPTIFAEMKKISCIDVDKVFTFKMILEALTELKVSFDQTQFYLDTFSAYLTEQMIELGYDFIESIDLKIKLKENE